MSPSLTLTNRPEDEYRQVLFDALTDAESGDELEVVADRDVDTHLVRYQIERGRAVKWEYEHPNEEPRKLQVTVGGPLADGELGTIDVRDLKPQRRHEALLDIFDELAPDEGFVLVNDHDPKPLYYEIRSMHGEVIDWEYESRGADGWRVKIEKTAQSEHTDEDVVTRYDVREIPKQERHPTIHHRYGMIPAGGTMELIAPHEPRPLRREFHQRYGDSFTWDVVEDEPGRCRVQVTKEEADKDTNSTEDTGPRASSSTDEAVHITEELDVRDLPPARRHELIYERYAGLDRGEGFILVNDHDPRPLYHQFEAEAGPEFRWEYRQKDHGEFRVVIGKADGDGSDVASEEPEAPF
ncbi:DUF2249 family protein (plasmid) [Haloferax gibbonsii]|uniref:DUF2249 family protein n=1 Tax=Haloferax gibbonsii TaxID=35746 RepID=A0A871BL04_HALGI|nr:DUF2249 domain-containing protein [Haloferax gibbonsii]QOS13479.1 DUF2249 family protein [Haloferax gibbonsii]